MHTMTGSYNSFLNEENATNANQIGGFLEYHSPFCNPFICHNFKGDRDEGQDVSNAVTLWECMPNVCRQRLNGFVVAVTILAFITTVFNAIMITINFSPTTRRMLNRNLTMQNYSTYVISLSCADLIMGCVVLPLIILYFYLDVFTTRKLFPTDDLRYTSNHSDSSFLHDWKSYPKMVQSLETFKYNQANSNRVIKGLKFDNGTQTFSINIDEGIQPLIKCLGLFFHLALFVSLYTIAAASADRFFVSTKAVTNRSIKLSSFKRSSFRRSRNLIQPERRMFHSVNRSTFVVILIWFMGALSIMPHIFCKFSRFRSVGHGFVILSFNGNYTADLYWYIVLLAIPLALTWLFSFLLCVTLWRRKNKLKKTSKTYSRKTGRDRRHVELEQDLSINQTSRYSNTDTPVITEPILCNTSDPNVARDSKLSDTISNTEFTEQKGSNYRVTNIVAQLNSSYSALTRQDSIEKQRPNSFDSLFGSKKFVESSPIRKQAINTQEKKLASVNRSHTINPGDVKWPSKGYVAKRILCRQSWGGYTSDATCKQDVNKCLFRASPLLTKQIESFQASSFSPAPVNFSPDLDRKHEISRPSQAATRLRRKSSAFRAREIIRSKSLESNIAKTLFAVVATLTCATLPLIIVFSKIIENTRNATVEEINDQVSVFTVSMTLLMSNSFWNCFIYGARMPYFRPALMRLLRKICRGRIQFARCRVVRKKFSVASGSSFKRKAISRPNLFGMASAHL